MQGGELILVWLEKDFEKKMQKSIDEIYNTFFKNIYSIERLDDNGVVNILDKEFAIDTIIHFKNGSTITCQEKSRRHKFFKYLDFTFELYNDPKMNQKGEWFHLSSQIYFYGFADCDESKHIQWYIIDLVRLRMWLAEFNDIYKKFQIMQNEEYGKANFVVIPFSEIPDNCFLIKKEYLSDFKLDWNEFNNKGE